MSGRVLFNRCASARSKIIAWKASAIVSARPARKKSIALKLPGQRVVAVGSTSTRTLEWIALQKGELVADEGIAQLVPSPRRPVSRARRPDHQLSSARFDAADSRRRVRRSRSGAAGLSRSDRAAVSVLQLRRRDAHFMNFGFCGCRFWILDWQMRNVSGLRKIAPMIENPKSKIQN